MTKWKHILEVSSRISPFPLRNPEYKYRNLNVGLHPTPKDLQLASQMTWHHSFALLFYFLEIKGNLVTFLKLELHLFLVRCADFSNLAFQKVVLIHQIQGLLARHVALLFFVYLISKLLVISALLYFTDSSSRWLSFCSKFLSF